MRKLLVAAASLATVSAPAAAENWVYVGKNTYNSTYEVDWDRLSRSGNTVTFWLKVHYGAGSPKSESDGYVARRQADCSDLSYHDVQTDYMKAGKVLKVTGEEEKRFAPPSSIAEGVLQKVCG
jgi:hypothetical protein